MPLFSVPGSDAQISTELFNRALPRPTLFIHGNLASNNWWQPSLEQWQARGRGQNWSSPMICAEFRGCGKSSAPKGPEDVDMHLFANDFIALTEALPSGEMGEVVQGPINLVGHSAGGLICALMAAKRPDLFDKILLLDPVGARGVVFDDSMPAAFEQMKKDKGLTATVIGSTIHGLNPQNRFFQSKIVEDAFHAVQTTGPWVLMALRAFDAREELKSVKSHGLVLHGEFDTLLPVADSQELAGLIKAEFKVIPEQGHCCNFENPEKFVDIAHRFLFSHA